MRYDRCTRLLRAILALPAMMPSAAYGSTLTPIFSIPGFNDGYLPTSGLTELGGKYYGTTYEGGTYEGTIYSIDSKNGAYAIVHYFAGGSDGDYPLSGLSAYQSKLYGVTSDGGANGGGVVFSVDPATGTETPVASLPAGVDPGVSLTLYQGRFYGTGQTSIFSFDPASGTVKVEYEFPQSGSDGFDYSALVAYGGFLYGTASGGGASGGGTLFRLDPSTDELTLEHVFGAGMDGSGPGGLTVLGGTLYGAAGGGQSGNGVIFSFDPATSAEATVYNFSSSSGIYPTGAMLASNGLLYGCTQEGSTYNYGTLYSFDPGSSALKVVHAFTRYELEGGDSLSLLGGMLWSASVEGGVIGDGAVYSIDPTSGNLTFHHQFSGYQRQGASALTKVNGNLFGTAVGGGAYGLGSIYKVDPVSGAGTTLYSFQGTGGAQPTAPLTNVNGVLYGTTSTGVSNDGEAPTYGTLFSLDLKSGAMTTLVNFDNAGLGGRPNGPLAMVGGALFGTTGAGGANSSGTIFKFDLSTNELTTVANFPNAYVNGPNGVTAAGSLLYGTTNGGGASDQGSIFSFDPSTGTLTTLLSFAGQTDSNFPLAPLSYINGLLYGTTAGFDQGIATIFRFDPATNVKTILHTLPKNTPVQAAPTERGSKLYTPFPVTNKKYFDGGFVQTNPDNGHSKLTILPTGPVENPASSLLQTNGGLFGTTSAYTLENAGTVFKYVP